MYLYRYHHSSISFFLLSNQKGEMVATVQTITDCANYFMYSVWYFKNYAYKAL